MLHHDVDDGSPSYIDDKLGHMIITCDCGAYDGGCRPRSEDKPVQIISEPVHIEDMPVHVIIKCICGKAFKEKVLYTEIHKGTVETTRQRLYKHVWPTTELHKGGNKLTKKQVRRLPVTCWMPRLCNHSLSCLPSVRHLGLPLAHPNRFRSADGTEEAVMLYQLQ